MVEGEEKLNKIDRGGDFGTKQTKNCAWKTKHNADEYALVGGFY